MRRRAGLTSVEALIVFLVLCALWWALMPGLRHARQGARVTKCANNLRQLGLGAIQYTDDKRFYPHLGSKRELDGGMETSDVPWKMRQLVGLGYVEPEGFVCPSSDDRALPIPDAARQDTRRWSWGGEAAPVDTGVIDPTLLETTELSFGWTRRFLTMGVRGSVLLGADRAARKHDGQARPPGLVGNHDDGVNVLQTDGTVRWLPASDPLAAHLADVTTVTLPGGLVLPPPALTVEPPVDLKGLSAQLDLPDAEQLAWSLGPPGALLVLLLGGVLVGRRRPASKGAES